jgi:hypothetical protein
MENFKNPRSLSDLIIDLKTRFSGQDVRVADVLDGFHERGFGFFLLIMALFCIVPIPTFGLKSLVCIPIILLAAQQAMGFHTLWMPNFIKKNVIKRDLFEGFMEHSLKWAKKMENIAKPRLGQVTSGFFSHLIGATGILMALCIIMPLPFTNTVPAIGLILMSVGVLVRDGLAVIAGMIIGTVWSIGWFAMFFYLGAAGINMLMTQYASIFS